MKKLIAFCLLVAGIAASTTSFAQEDKSKRPSPPAELATTVDGLSILINYSQPAVKGRTIGKDIAPYGEVWRTGANEATTFEINRDVKIEGKELKAGKYSLFTIPGEKEWVIIFNSQPTQWGAYKYDESKDVLRVTVPSIKAKNFTERMTFGYNSGDIVLMWADTQVGFSVK
jgi:hypothetical protein